MDDRRPLVCPVLVGRDDLLALADRRIAEVAAGGGRFLPLAGEAGVGKTRLLGSMERRAGAARFRTVRGGAYPSDVQVPAAILIDTARALQRQLAFAEIGTLLGQRLEELSITRKTVASHVEHILAKLGVGRRAEIAVWASTRTSSRTAPTPVLGASKR